MTKLNGYLSDCHSSTTQNHTESLSHPIYNNIYLRKSGLKGVSDANIYWRSSQE